MEHKINEIITYKLKDETIHLEVIPTKCNTCEDCFFYKTCCSAIRNIMGTCDKNDRTDKISVIFRKINSKLMKKITLEEARELYKQGGMAKEIALRVYTEKEIVNDYTLITSLRLEQ